jgi:hypothetical protein
MKFHKQIVFDAMVEAFHTGTKSLNRHEVAILLAGPGATAFIDRLVQSVWNSGLSICTQMHSLGVPVVGLNIRYEEEGEEEPQNERDAYRLMPKGGLPLVTLVKITDFHSPLWHTFWGNTLLPALAKHETELRKVTTCSNRGWLPAGYVDQLDRESFYELVHRTS